MKEDYAPLFEGKEASQVASDDYVMQHNHISRAAYIMPVMCRRLTALAMARVRADGSDDLAVKINVGDALKALGMDDKERNYDMLRRIGSDLIQQAIEFYTGDPYQEWAYYAWFSYVRFNSEDDALELKFNESLRRWIREFKEAYERLEIAHIARFRGKYAIRIFEILMSLRGTAGKAGNGPGKWFWEVSVDELRTLLKIEPGTYKEGRSFRQKVVDAAVDEINNARVGIEVKLTPKYYHRYLRSLRFDVRLKTSKASRQVGPNVVSDDDEQLLLDANPEAWEEAQAAAKEELGPANEMKLQARAWELFTARDDLHYPKRPRGRPRKQPSTAGAPE